MVVNLQRIADATARRVCTPNGSYDADDAAQIALLAMHRQMHRWEPGRGQSERDFAIGIARNAIHKANRIRANRPAGHSAVKTGEAITHAGFAETDAKDELAAILKHATRREKAFAKAYLELADATAVGRRFGVSGQTVGESLRRIEARQNQRSVSRATRHGYRGIMHVPRNPGKPWLGRLEYQGKRLYGPYRRSKYAAARDYDAMAKRYHGARAKLNFPGGEK